MKIREWLFYKDHKGEYRAEGYEDVIDLVTRMREAHCYECWNYTVRTNRWYSNSANRYTLNPIEKVVPDWAKTLLLIHKMQGE